MSPIVLIRGGGDLASGVAMRLWRAGIQVVITELPRPLMVRRLVCFGEAVYAGEHTVEEVTAVLANDAPAAEGILAQGQLPVLVDPESQAIAHFQPLVVVDARMRKKPPELPRDIAPLTIGLGPGFTAGLDCHAVIETNRGHFLGRVIWEGQAQANTGVPGAVAQHAADRVLRAPADGELRAFVEIGSYVEADQPILEVGGKTLHAPFAGVLRGLLHPGLEVTEGMKIGDVDPRRDLSYARLISEKSLAIGGGVMEAILSKPELRAKLWTC
ncbi:MAG: EF2563 family selenium-dependent molybdenum hydroxylase system protein [Anaerolineales bacterium]|nr:EF2563 family selenium-dependent molybdenum hydroxylase system protein [Anaerolineales bacterium]